MKKKNFFIFVFVFFTVAIVIYVSQVDKYDNNQTKPEVIEKEVTFDRAIQLTEEQTELPISLPNSIPYQMEEKTASVNFYEYDNNEKFHEVEFYYENNNEVMKVIVSNVKAQREEGILKDFGVEGLTAHYIENNGSQLVWWEFEESVYYTLIFNSKRALLEEAELSSLVNQITLGGQDG